MLLSLLLAVQLFTTAQEQVRPAGAQPVEVLQIELQKRELKGEPFRVERDRDRDTRPPGPFNTANIPGTRGSTTTKEKLTIEERSRELRELSRKTSGQPVPRVVVDQYSYHYRLKLKNASAKKIKSILWEYQLTDGSDSTILGERLFLCGLSLKPGDTKGLQAKTFSRPDRVVSADTIEDTTQKAKVVIYRVEFVDGSTWTRNGWKPEDLPRPDAITKGVRDGRCGAL